MDVLQLKITLLEIEPKIYRIVQVPASINLRDLHSVIQAVMEWEGYHSYQFIKGHEHFGPKPLALDLPVMQNDDTVRLADLLKEPRQKLLYEYDFGDGWLHEVLLQKQLPPEEGVRYPICLEGKGAGPPEDSGGAMGYCNLLQALEDPNHELYQDARNWLGADYDPRLLDLSEVNPRLRQLKIR